MKELESENALLREKIESLFSSSVSRYLSCLFVSILIYLFGNCAYSTSEKIMKHEHLPAGKTSDRKLLVPNFC